PVTKPGGESRMPMIAWAVTLLPQPDSPRMARVSPASRWKLTPFTACATPARVRNSTWRSTTSSGGAEASAPGTAPNASTAMSVALLALMSVAISTSPQPRVEGVAQGVADQDERQHRAEQQPGREQQQAGVLEEQCLVLSDHDAPGDRRRLQADAEEGQGRLRGHERAEQDGGVDQHRRHRVREDVLEHQAPVLGAERLRRLHIVEVLRGEHVAP